MSVSWLQQVGEWCEFALRVLPSVVRSVVVPRYWLRPFYQVLVGALPLAIVTGCVLGLVIWVHTRGVLERSGTGAVEFLPTFLSAAVLLELAPVSAGLIVAARTGASLGAELASMKVNEQLDALSLLGVSPLRRLVGPRVWVCMLVVPLLHIIIAACALGSGLLAELFGAESTWLKYQSAALRELYLADIVPAALKTIVFGALVGITGCYFGIKAGPGSEGVGDATTSSVVACSLFVLIADLFLVSIIRLL